MEIIFLGTGYGAPTAERQQQSILVRENDALYLFDAGGGALDALIRYGYSPCDLRAIFISHSHGDHMNGLHDILNLAEHFSIKCPVYLSEKRGILAFSAFSFFQSRKKCALELRLIGSGEFYSDENISVCAILTAHMLAAGIPSYAFYVSGGGKSVAITGDLSPTLEDFPTRYADLFITECAHFSADSVCQKLGLTKTPRAAVIHVMPNEKYADFEALAGLPFSLLLPKDGDKIVL